jgi:hypothetical protein
VDYEAPAFTNMSNGNLFQPFPTLTAAFRRVKSSKDDTLISVVRGSYPEEIEPITGLPRDIVVELNGTLTLVLPVGSVAIWGKAGADPE